jgi:hypothetical protein
MEGAPKMKNVAQQEKRLLGVLALGCYATTLIAFVFLCYSLASLYRDLITQQLLVVSQLH